jgi:hypothetical protein
MRRSTYIENKTGGLTGLGRIGSVELARSTGPYTYDGKRFQKMKSGYKYNGIEEETSQYYWISGNVSCL